MTQNENACPTCDHVRADGSLCLSPALTTGRFCYYHTRDRQRRRNMRHAADLAASPKYTAAHSEQLSAVLLRSLDLPDLEDATAIQVSLSNLIRALAYGHIEQRRAALMVRILRAAIMNLRNLPQLEPTELMATEDAEPVAPLIQPCAPEPWELGVYPERSDEGPLSPPAPSAHCHPERPSCREGPLSPTETPCVDKPETRNEEPSSHCHPEERVSLRPEAEALSEVEGDEGSAVDCHPDRSGDSREVEGPRVSPDAESSPLMEHHPEQRVSLRPEQALTQVEPDQEPAPIDPQRRAEEPAGCAA